MTYEPGPNEADHIANVTLQHVRSMRRENAALLEQNKRLFEQIVRLQSTVLSLQSEIQAMRAEMNELRGDILMLENHNVSRHGEVLSIVRRLDEAEIPASLL